MSDINQNNNNEEYEEATVSIEAKDERRNEIGSEIYWYLGMSATPPVDLKEYELDSNTTHTFTNGIENKNMYIHIRDNNGNLASTTIKFDRRDKIPPTIKYETLKYYEYNEYEDIKITVADEESNLSKIKLYYGETEGEYVEFRDGIVYLYYANGNEFLNFPAAEGYDLGGGIAFLPQTD